MGTFFPKMLLINLQFIFEKLAMPSTNDKYDEQYQD